jgi:uncharacterized membrane protein HdeD (DUF308 family)
MEENKKHTTMGIISLILGILGVLTILNWYWTSILSWGFIPFVLGLLAIITGWSARKKGDNFGTIGLILGLIAFLIGILQIIFFIWNTYM